MCTRKLFSTFALLLLAGLALAQQPVFPAGDKEPFLRLEAGGPTAYVTSLAFSPDGKLLYAAGYDKVVRAWRLDAPTGKFVPERRAYRVPIGPGLDAAINALAVSPDGDWLAVAGIGIVRGGASFRRPGLVLFQDSVMTAAMWKDQGTIYVFNTRTGAARLLRGHLGPVLALAFAPRGYGKPPLLVSAAQERDTENKKFVGGLRLWDVTRAKNEDAYLDGRWGLALSGLGTRPGLAVWHTGRKLKQLKVAIAWGDGKLRLWDVEEKEGLWPVEDGRYNNTAVYSAALGQVISSSFRGRNGRLQAWNMSSGEHIVADSDHRASFDADGRAYAFPRALTLLSSRAGGDLDQAAVVLRVPAREEEYRLHLLDLNPEQFGAVRAEKVLWKGGRGGADVPVVAAAPGGRHLAVAGNNDHEIVIYRIDDLLHGRGAGQRLRSVGATLRNLAFVTNQRNELGLWLTEAGKKVAGNVPARLPDDSLVFDFVRRSLLSDSEGWQMATPAAGAWEVETSVADRDADNRPVRWSLSVRHDGEEQQRIGLKASSITDYALLPPRKPWNVPILAVAWLDDKVQPWLYLYNGASGEQIRRYSGHTDRIRALAFSPDGRLLASAADDQTVSVWSLTDLAAFLGQRGMLVGVGVRSADGGLAVAHIDEGSAAGKALDRGDLIEGLVEGKTLHRLKSPLEFYDAISLLKPGQTVSLHVRGKGDVAVKLSHAIDDCKPLLTLFITRADESAAREWVGWNPHGHYDASDRKTERLIGWHFNTGQPDAPAEFALADQYRGDYYREGILKHLVAEGSLSPALRAWEKEDRAKEWPRPKMTVWSHPLGPDPAHVDARGETLVRHPQDLLMMAVDDFPLRKLESVTWQVDGGPVRAFDAAPTRERSADLSRLPWKAGDRYKIRVVLRTREAEPREYARELTLRYQPPPPEVALKGAGSHLLATKAGFKVQAKVRPAAAGQEISVRLSQRHQDKELLPAAEQVQHLTIDQELELRPGDNLIEVAARNKGVLRDHQDLETTRKTLLVTFIPDDKKVPPPRIALDRVVPAGGGQPASVPIQPGQAAVVHVPRVRIEGTIDAPREKLSRAEWARGEARRGEPLEDFRPGRQDHLDIDQELALEPGHQVVRFTAKTPGSEAASGSVAIDYLPPLPRVGLTEPLPDTVLYDEGQGPPQVTVKVRVFLPAVGWPFVATVLINGKEVPHKVDEQHTLSARFTPQPLENRIQVRLSSRWQPATMAADVRLRYLRPPRILKTEQPVVGEKALTDLVARVDSALPLAGESVEAEINGDAFPVDRIEVEKQGARWQVRLKDVALRPGANEGLLLVRNAEATCRLPGVWKFDFKPTAAPPVVEVLDPAKNVTLTEWEVTVRFRVKSASPLRRVELVREGAAPLRQSFDVARAKPDANGFFEWQAMLPLVSGDNRLRLEAVNDGGARQAAVVANYLHLPVRLVIDSLASRGGQPVRPQVLSGGRLYFPTMPEGRLTLTGRVVWDHDGDESLKKTRLVRLYVNGFQQVPAWLKPAGGRGRERAFTADILLNQAQGNLIEIALPDVPAEAGNRSEFRVACAHPARGQRLHLLIIGIGEKSARRLLAQALGALRARRDSHGRYWAPAFDEVRVYGPLSGYVTPDQVFTQLCLIKKTIDLLAREGSSNDVVWVYYKGAESVGRQGHFFLTSVSNYTKDLGRSGVTCDGLTDFFAETLGAQLLLLDVTPVPPPERLAPGEAPDRVAEWPVDSNVAVTRYRKLKGPRDSALLLTDLREFMPRVSTWGDVVRLVREKTARMDPGTLLVFQRLRESLEGLTIGASP